jgi:hypothetical protein
MNFGSVFVWRGLSSVVDCLWLRHWNDAHGAGIFARRHNSCFSLMLGTSWGVKICVSEIRIMSLLPTEFE